MNNSLVSIPPTLEYAHPQQRPSRPWWLIVGALPVLLICFGVGGLYAFGSIEQRSIFIVSIGLVFLCVGGSEVFVLWRPDSPASVVFASFVFAASLLATAIGALFFFATVFTATLSSMNMYEAAAVGYGGTLFLFGVISVLSHARWLWTRPIEP